MLFLILAWRTWVPRVQDMFLSSSPRVNGYGSVCNEPFPITNSLISYFRWREGVPTSVLGSQPIIWLLPPSPLVSGDLRLLSTNICWYPLCDLHSFLTVTFLTGCHCSFQREDSSHPTSIVSVGYHVTNPRRLICHFDTQVKIASSCCCY